ncbi:MAG: nicotinate-nucleotide--dimethylbenzimidazole phosphoribosyltransferase, partial [Quinella sp. 2Q5]|nr:nicotinate-nucleotide--dimethylbenzimidazole phosphoribosyltransferase [Quinella sp. 2Q5]
MNSKILEILNDIEEMGDLDQEAVKAAEARQEVLAKPTGALGDLEEMTVRLAGITGLVKNDMKKQAVAIFSADNGVVDEGVASAPQSVTFSQTINFTRGLTGVSSMAKYWGIDLLVCDMGVKMDLPEELVTDSMVEQGCDDCDGTDCRNFLTKKIVNRRLARGTANLAKGPAMTEEQFEKAFL